MLEKNITHNDKNHQSDQPRKSTRYVNKYFKRVWGAMKNFIPFHFFISLIQKYPDSNSSKEGKQKYEGYFHQDCHQYLLIKLIKYRIYISILTTISFINFMPISFISYLIGYRFFKRILQNIEPPFIPYIKANALILWVILISKLLFGIEGFLISKFYLETDFGDISAFFPYLLFMIPFIFIGLAQSFIDLLIINFKGGRNETSV